MPKTLADHRDQARAQLDDESIVAAIPALTYPYRNESLRLLERLLPRPRKAWPRLLLFRERRVDIHTQRWSKQAVGPHVSTLRPSGTRLTYVEDTREGSTRVEFGGVRFTVLDEHMAALYQVADRAGFAIDAADDPRAAN